MTEDSFDWELKPVLSIPLIGSTTSRMGLESSTTLPVSEAHPSSWELDRMNRICNRCTGMTSVSSGGGTSHSIRSKNTSSSYESLLYREMTDRLQVSKYLARIREESMSTFSLTVAPSIRTAFALPRPLAGDSVRSMRLCPGV